MKSRLVAVAHDANIGEHWWSRSGHSSKEVLPLQLQTGEIIALGITPSVLKEQPFANCHISSALCFDALLLTQQRETGLKLSVQKQSFLAEFA